MYEQQKERVILNWYETCSRSTKYCRYVTQ